MTPDEFRAWLAAIHPPAILDGGLAVALESTGRRLPADDRLWTSRLLVDDPPALRDAADGFLSAGADITSTATYQASQAAFAASHVCRDDAAVLMQSAVEIGRAAVRGAATSLRRPLVALSLGPYAATLGDGAEYRGHEPGAESRERRAHYHERRAHVFFPSGDEAGTARCVPDVVAYETIPAVAEAVFVTEMMAGRSEPRLRPPPFWVSFQCRTERHIASGELLADAARAVLRANGGHPGLVALGVNCCDPHWLPALVGTVRGAIDAFAGEAAAPQPTIATVAYPNSGETWVKPGGWTWPADRPPLSEAAWAEVTLAAGADIVGGCCQCGFGHVRARGERRPQRPRRRAAR
jgi:homocysteine S-methyltransferase